MDNQRASKIAVISAFVISFLPFAALILGCKFFYGRDISSILNFFCGGESSLLTVTLYIFAVGILAIFVAVKVYERSWKWVFLPIVITVGMIIIIMASWVPK